MTSEVPAARDMVADTKRQIERIAAFFRDLYGDDAPGHRVIYTLPAKRAYWFPANDPEAAAATIPALVRAGQNVYHVVCPQDKEAALEVARVREDVRARKAGEKPRRISEKYTRGFAETAVALPCLWGDFDMLGDGHAKPNLPPNEDAVRSLVREIGREPSLIISTGHGWHCYWLLRELWVFETPDERQRARELSSRWQLTLSAVAQRQGWDVDHTHDLARVLRVPYTLNWKGVDRAE
jgi:putative DNA primase/helicase